MPRRPIPAIESQFENDLRDAAQICIREHKYRPTYFLAMLGERGGLATAKALLSKTSPSQGFTKLVVDIGHPELTVEDFVLEPRYQQLFTADEITKARRWLGRN